MTDTDALEAIAHAAGELVPQLGERLERHGLGEIEVKRGDLRLRVVARGEPGAVAAVVRDDRAASGGPRPEPTASGGDAGGDEPPRLGVPSPAVGFFVYADGLGPGLDVAKGEPIGYVEMLGVRHEVRVPRSGTVRHLVAESGEAVEYGQTVVEIEAAEVRR